MSTIRVGRLVTISCRKESFMRLEIRHVVFSGSRRPEQDQIIRRGMVLHIYSRTSSNFEPNAVAFCDSLDCFLIFCGAPADGQEDQDEQQGQAESDSFRAERLFCRGGEGGGGGKKEG